MPQDPSPFELIFLAQRNVAEETVLTTRPVLTFGDSASASIINPDWLSEIVVHLRKTVKSPLLFDGWYCSRAWWRPLTCFGERRAIMAMDWETFQNFA